MFMRCRWEWAVVALMLSFVPGCSENKPAPTGGAGTTGGAGANSSGTAAATVEPTACPGAVTPTFETIRKGEYVPLSRPLFIYVNKKAITRPEVVAFVKFILGEGQQYIPEVGSVQVDDALLKQQVDKFNAAAGDAAVPEKLAGAIAVDGSSTVFPIMEAAAEEFRKKNGEINISIGKTGTGGGFKRFCTGETDISNASRAIKSEEAKTASENGVEYVELQVAIDGLSVCVNPANDWCTCLTVEQLKEIWLADSKITKWSDINPAWPAEKISFFGADTQSGTYDYFKEEILGKTASIRSDYQASSEDNQLVAGVEGDKYSMGFFGFGYFDQNRNKLKVLAITPKAKEEKKPEAAK